MSLRPTASAMLLAGLLLPVALAAPLHDQVANGGLDDWNAPGTVPEGWRVELGTVTRSDFTSEGPFAAQLRAKPNELGNHLSILAQDIPNNALPGAAPRDLRDLPILAGQFYELAFDAAGSYNGKGRGNASVTWLGTQGAVLRVDTLELAEAAAYSHFSAQYQAPVDPLAPDAALRATLRFVVDGQSSDDKVNLWVDAVSFGPAAPVALPELPA